VLHCVCVLVHTCKLGPILRGESAPSWAANHHASSAAVTKICTQDSRSPSSANRTTQAKERAQINHAAGMRLCLLVCLSVCLSVSLSVCLCAGRALRVKNRVTFLRSIVQKFITILLADGAQEAARPATSVARSAAFDERNPGQKLDHQTGQMDVCLQMDSGAKHWDRVDDCYARQEEKKSLRPVTCGRCSGWAKKFLLSSPKVSTTIWRKMEMEISRQTHSSSGLFFSLSLSLSVCLLPLHFSCTMASRQTASHSVHLWPLVRVARRHKLGAKRREWTKLGLLKLEICLGRQSIFCPHFALRLVLQ